MRRTPEEIELDKVWKQCLTMWRWVVEWHRKDPSRPIWELKADYLAEKHLVVFQNCFFCEYDEKNKKPFGLFCDSCPGVLVSRRFSCNHHDYYYAKTPEKFLAKIERLNRTRLERRAKKNPRK